MDTAPSPPFPSILTDDNADSYIDSLLEENGDSAPSPFDDDGEGEEE